MTPFDETRTRLADKSALRRLAVQIPVADQPAFLAATFAPEVLQVAAQCSNPGLRLERRDWGDVARFVVLAGDIMLYDLEIWPRVTRVGSRQVKTRRSSAVLIAAYLSGRCFTIKHHNPVEATSWLASLGIPYQELLNVLRSHGWEAEIAAATATAELVAPTTWQDSLAAPETADQETPYLVLCLEGGVITEYGHAPSLYHAGLAVMAHTDADKEAVIHHADGVISVSDEGNRDAWAFPLTLHSDPEADTGILVYEIGGVA